MLPAQIIVQKSGWGKFRTRRSRTLENARLCNRIQNETLRGFIGPWL